MANANISIELYDAQSSAATAAATGIPESDGTFHIGGIPAGMDLRIRVNPPGEGNLTFEYWNNKPDYNSADRVPALSAGELRQGSQSS